MTTVVLLLGLLLAAGGLVLLAAPQAVLRSAELFLTPAGLWIAVLVRLSMGVLLLLAASATKAPLFVGGLGVLLIAAALLLPVLGLARIKALFAWFSEGKLRRSAAALIALVLAAGLIWAAWL